MFDDRDGGEAESAAGRGWTVPGRPAASTPLVPDACAVALVQSVDALLAQQPSALPGPMARERARTVLAQAQRLEVVVADALGDVQARELFADGHAGSLSGWLRQQPCGDGGRVSRSRRLAARGRVRSAIVDGGLGTSTADVLAKALDDLPETTEPGQVEGVLTGAVPELLSRWTACNALDSSGDAVTDARAAAAREAIEEGVAAGTASPAERLEAAYVLLGQAVAPAAPHPAAPRRQTHRRERLGPGLTRPRVLLAPRASRDRPAACSAGCRSSRGYRHLGGERRASGPDAREGLSKRQAPASA